MSYLKSSEGATFCIHDTKREFCVAAVDTAQRPTKLSYEGDADTLIEVKVRTIFDASSSSFDFENRENGESVIVLEYDAGHGEKIWMGID